MANIKSAKKEMRKAARRATSNRSNRSRLHTALKKIRAMLSAKDAPGARSAWPKVMSILDRSVKAGILHHRTAARTKSRLASAVHRLQAG